MNDKKHSRRNALRLTAGAVTILTGKILQGQILTTPTATEGPFWEDEKLNRSDIRASGDGKLIQDGLPLYLGVSVSRLSNQVVKPLRDAQVDIWHCNAMGAYSDEAAGMGNPNTLGQTWLRGYQVTNARGVCRFTTIYPGWYQGRTCHIHVRVRTTSLNITSQFFFDDAITDKVYSTFAPYNTRGNRGTRNSNDNIYNTRSAASTVACPDGCRLQLRLAQHGSRALASFNIVVS
jgi:protocatechuate 3,4-dioxygenase beta subunit